MSLSPKIGEKFSELWLLGHIIGQKITRSTSPVGNPTVCTWGVGDHLGSSVYYAVYIKFRNQTQPLPKATTSAPSPLPILGEVRAFVQDGQTSEKLMTFSVLEASQSETSSIVNRLVISDRAVWTNSSAVWDSVRKGVYYELFFELWVYDTVSKNLGFHNRFVGIWLNMT